MEALNIDGILAVLDTPCEFAKVRVGGVTRTVEIERDGDWVYALAEISYKHRTGKETYSYHRNHVVLDKKTGVYTPMQKWVLRRPCWPHSWGEGTTTREY
jgi:hypothetical protein